MSELTVPPAQPAYSGIDDHRGVLIVQSILKLTGYMIAPIVCGPHHVFTLPRERMLFGIKVSAFATRPTNGFCDKVMSRLDVKYYFYHPRW